jgi:cytochrome P450
VINIVEGHAELGPPLGVPVWEIDPYCPEVLSKPENYYAELRARGPFVYIPKYAILACGRYDVTKKVFSDWERFVSSQGVGLQDFQLEKPWRPPSIVLEVDPPYHDKTRRVLNRALSPKAVADLKQAFHLAAQRLIDDLLARDSFDAIPELAEAFPTSVFPQAVGLGDTDRRRLIDYGGMVFNALGPDNELRRSAMAQASEIVPWIMDQCRREALKPGGFGASIYEAADTGEISEEEAGMLVRSLLSAGVDTTVAALGNAIWCLAANPAEFERLKADPSLARPAFEETLRYTSPVHSFCRTARVDTELSGIDIAAGTKILCVLAAANLDEDHWSAASRFDIARRPAGHLALGVGIHNCVGQNVARAEGEAVLSALAAKVRKIDLAGEPIWRPNNAMRALDQLQIRFRRH